MSFIAKMKKMYIKKITQMIHESVSLFAELVQNVTNAKIRFV